MRFLKKHVLEISLLIAILAIYFLIRLPQLTYQPIFADEAIYIRWSQVMKSEPTLRFLPLSDGKTPLYMWILMPVFKIVDDPLLAGRLLSVFCGVLTLAGVYLLSRKFINKQVALISAFLIATTPFMFFFDRLALVDSLLAAFTIWTIFFALWIQRSYRLDLAMFLGFMIGGGLLTKTPAMFNVLVLPFSLITFDWKEKNRARNLLKVIGLWVVAFQTSIL